MARVRSDYRLCGTRSEMVASAQSNTNQDVKLYESAFGSNEGAPGRAETCIRGAWWRVFPVCLVYKRTSSHHIAEIIYIFTPRLPKVALRSL